jgi:hypothetical protein
MGGDKGRGVRVTGRLDEVDTSVNSIVVELESVHAVLLLEVGVVSSFDVVNDGFPSTHRHRSAPQESQSISSRLEIARLDFTQQFSEEGGEDARIIVVDEITEPRSVDNVESKTDARLFDVGGRALDGDGWWPLGAGRRMRLFGLDGGGEEGVDKGGLSETRFTCWVRGWADGREEERVRGGVLWSRGRTSGI